MKIRWALFIITLIHISAFVWFTCLNIPHCVTGNWMADNVVVPIGAVTLVLMWIFAILGILDPEL